MSRYSVHSINERYETLREHLANSQAHILSVTTRRMRKVRRNKSEGL